MEEIAMVTTMKNPSQSTDGDLVRDLEDQIDELGQANPNSSTGTHQALDITGTTDHDDNDQYPDHLTAEHRV